MIKVLKILGLIILGLILIVCVVGLFAPKEFSIERSTTIEAPQEQIFQQVKFLKNWDSWLPWAKGDPSFEVTYGGVDGQPGASYSWTGKQSGKGSVTITSIDNKRMDYDMLFIEPFHQKSQGWMITEKTGPQETKVTWGFRTHYSFPMNALMLLMNMKDMLAKDFDKGLDLLKGRAESFK